MENSKILRKHITKFTPNVGLSIINYKRMGDIDKFYMDCQIHRDFYKDSTAKLRGIEYFNIPLKEYATRPDLTSVYLTIPQDYHKLPQPIIYSLPLSQGPVSFNGIIDFKGTYNVPSCIKYKR